jgi:hypothetical protein
VQAPSVKRELAVLTKIVQARTTSSASLRIAAGSNALSGCAGETGKEYEVKVFDDTRSSLDFDGPELT